MYILYDLEENHRFYVYNQTVNQNAESMSEVKSLLFLITPELQAWFMKLLDVLS